MIIAFTLTACSRSAPDPEPRPQPSEQAPLQATEAPTRNRSWSFIRDDRPQRYSTAVTTLLELQGDTTTTKETFEIFTDFTLIISAKTIAITVSGLIEDLKLNGSGRTRQEASQAFTPFSFSGRIENGTMALDSAGGSAFQTLTGCDNPGLNAVTALNRSVVILPLTITTGMTWTDSSTVSGCSGSLPVQLTAIRSYRVVGETKKSGAGLLAIDRADRVRVAGEGSQGQHRVQLQATGFGSARILVDTSSGTLREMEGEQKTDVIVTASGRSQHFVQTVREKTVARKPAL